MAIPEAVPSEGPRELNEPMLGHGPKAIFPRLRVSGCTDASTASTWCCLVVSRGLSIGSWLRVGVESGYGASCGGSGRLSLNRP